MYNTIAIYYQTTTHMDVLVSQEAGCRERPTRMDVLVPEAATAIYPQRLQSPFLG